MPVRSWFPSSVLAATLLFVPFSLRSQTSIQTSTPGSSTAFTNNLMPEPSSLTGRTGSFPVNSSLTVALTGVHSPRLEAAVLRSLKRLEDKTGQPLPRSIGSSTTGTLTINVTADPPLQTIDEDESYTLSVTPSGLAIKAPTITGALHALETLLQLVQPSGAAYILPAVTITDSPRFRWRGLMIDCGRHFEPMDVLKRNLDAMAAVKLNVFHWHLTEDQGFRMESKLFPKLTGLGSDGLFYTQDDARELVRYAHDRGIRVIPEFEMPGHSAAWLFAYPELASGSNPTGLRREFGISDFAMDPTREETYKFLSRFLGEMVTLFPDQYVHIGGDEAPAPDWKKNTRILAFMKAHDLKDNDALQAYFNQRVLKILTGLHRRMVGWDEIFNPALPKDVVIQSWRGEASLAKGAQQGYQGVLSAPYYLDAMKPAGVHYLADPVPFNTTLSPSEQKLILGGEVAMWAEQLDARTIDSRIWPRTAAMAERFWSPQTVTDVDDMYRRLEPVSIDLEALGLHHISAETAALRELAGTDRTSALETFAEAFEPVSFSDRYEQQHTSQLTPLTNFVDAVRPDPPSRHHLEVATRTFLADPHSSSTQVIAARQQLNAFFQAIGTAVPEVRQQMLGSPRLQAIQPRVEQLGPLALAGIEAALYLSSNTPAPTGWKAKNLALIEAAKKPGAIVRFTFLQPLTDLVNATPEKK
jgi:hexosaminidase